MKTARKKAKPAARPSWPTRLIRLLRSPAGPLVWIGLLTILLAVAGYLVWCRVASHVLASEQYLLGPQQVEITPPPEWIHADIRSDVFRDGSLDSPLSIMDENLAERIASAFSLNPWVAEVVRVSKHTPARVDVDLVYRQPVCMVAAPGNLLPVDADGVLLPYGNDDFSAVEKSRYPRLVGVSTGPVGAVGECWGDPRVIGGAEIAAALREVWDELGLHQIVPSGPLATGVAEEPTYTLVTRGGTEIPWGRAPGTHAPGELPVAEKIARLLDYAQHNGTLEGAGGHQVLNVLSLRGSPYPTR